MNRFSPKSDVKFCLWKTSNSLNQIKDVPTLMKYPNGGRHQWPILIYLMFHSEYNELLSQVILNSP